MADTKDKTGVFTGAYAINPVNDEKIPIYIADYVLMGYGTGAIMAVPAHDERDFEFAKKFELPIKHSRSNRSTARLHAEVAAFVGRRHRHQFPHHRRPADRAGQGADHRRCCEAEGVAHKSVNYKLRDWLFYRQRYWGEPFPILLDEKDDAYALDESELPLTLPRDGRISNRPARPSRR